MFEPKHFETHYYPHYFFVRHEMVKTPNCSYHYKYAIYEAVDRFPKYNDYPADYDERLVAFVEEDNEQGKAYAEILCNALNATIDPSTIKEWGHPREYYLPKEEKT